MPDAFASPAELATFLRTASQVEADAGSGDVLDTGTALLALSSASGAIRSVCGWSISQETVTEMFTLGQTVFLPTLNLTAVSVPSAVDGVAWSRNGTVRLSNLYPFAASAVVTYTHGYDPVPDAVKAVCLELAARHYINPEQMMSVTRGSVTDVFSYRSDPGTSLKDDPRLQPFMLPGVA
jgi:hypothetical protein